MNKLLAGYQKVNINAPLGIGFDSCYVPRFAKGYLEDTCASALTNGYEGYFPVKAAYDEGGYEARSSRYKSSVAETIVEGGKRIIAELADL